MLPHDSLELRFIPEAWQAEYLAKASRLDGASPSQLAAMLFRMTATEGNLFRAAELLRRERRDRAAALMATRKARQAEWARQRRVSDAQGAAEAAPSL